MMDAAFLLVGALACALPMIALAGGAWFMGRASRPRATSPSTVPSSSDPLAKAVPRSPTIAAGGEHTFLVADLVGFTALTETYGNSRAALVAQEFFAAARARMPVHGVEEVKTLGDGLLLRAAQPEAAVRLGVQLVTELAARREFPPVRVGIASGRAVEHDGDWFGAAVNLAARVAGAAAGGEVLVAEHTVAPAGDIADVALHDRAERRLRNISAPVAVYRATPAGGRHAPRTPTRASHIAASPALIVTGA